MDGYKDFCFLGFHATHPHATVYYIISGSHSCRCNKAIKKGISLRAECHIKVAVLLTKTKQTQEAAVGDFLLQK